MSRRPKSERGTGNAERETPGAVPRSPPRVPRFRTALAVILALAIAARYVYNRAGSRLAFPPPAPPSAIPVALDTGFIGSEACAACHASEYAQWIQPRR